MGILNSTENGGNETTTEQPISNSTGTRDWPIHIKIHGLIMILAWLVLACISILINRYYKAVWPKTTLWGKPLWFQLHRITMVTVAVLTVVGVIIVYACSESYDGMRDFTESFFEVHPPAGIAILVLVLVNPLLAFCRPPLGSKYKPCWYIIHFLIGVVAYVLANFNVYTAFHRSRDINPKLYQVFTDFLFAYWILVCLTVVVLESFKMYRQCKNASSEHEREPLKETGEADIQKGGVRFLKAWFSIFVFIVLVAFVAWIIILFFPGGMYRGMEEEELNEPRMTTAVYH